MSVRETFCHFFGVVIRSSRGKKGSHFQTECERYLEGSGHIFQKAACFCARTETLSGFEALRRRQTSLPPAAISEMRLRNGPEVSGLFPSARRQLCIPDVWTEVSLAAPVSATVAPHRVTFFTEQLSLECH